MPDTKAEAKATERPTRPDETSIYTPWKVVESEANIRIVNAINDTVACESKSNPKSMMREMSRRDFTTACRAVNSLPLLEKAVKALGSVQEILFPEPVFEDENHSTDYSADENLEAVLIDLEARGADAVCLSTIRKVIDQLYRAREVLSSLKDNAHGK